MVTLKQRKASFGSMSMYQVGTPAACNTDLAVMETGKTNQ